MAQLDPAVVSNLVGPLAGVSGIIVVTFLVMRYKLKKKELEMRGSDAELGPVVDALRDDFEQLAEVQEHTRAQLAEVQERLDFTERVLAAGRESQEDRSG